MSKYHNKKVSNIYGDFDSIKEYERYLVLLDMVRRGKITELHRQVKYQLLPAQYRTETVQLKTKTKEVERLMEKECCYIADFTYYDKGVLTVEDCKGLRTKEYRLKRKMMLYFHNIVIRET